MSKMFERGYADFLVKIGMYKMSQGTTYMPTQTGEEEWGAPQQSVAPAPTPARPPVGQVTMGNPSIQYRPAPGGGGGGAAPNPAAARSMAANMKQQQASRNLATAQRGLPV